MVKASKLCVWSDAFLADRSLVVCREMDPEGGMVFIENRWVPEGRKAYSLGAYQDGKRAFRKAAGHLRGECNVVVSASKELAKEVAEVLEPSGPTMLICSETGDDVKKRLEDVNSFLEPYRHFVYTSALTVGVSYDRKDHYDNLLMYTSACSNHVRDSMQAGMRVRHIKSGTLFYATYPRYYGHERFDVCSRGRLRAMIEGREAWLGSRDDQMFGRREQLQQWQRSLWVFSTQENNVSAFLHAELVEEYLRLCGYELMGRRETSLLSEVEAHNNALDLQEIPAIDKARFDELGELIQRGAASTAEKVGWLKGNFMFNIVRDPDSVDSEVLQGMFETYAKKQMAIQSRLNNRRMESQPESTDQLLSIFQDNTAQKLEAIRNICDMLQIRGSWEVGAQIERSILSSSCSKVLAMRNELKEVFDLRLRETKRKDTLKRGLELLNEIWSRWGYTAIKLDGPRKRARVEGRLQDMSNYAVVEGDQFPGFARYT